MDKITLPFYLKLISRRYTSNEYAVITAVLADYCLKNNVGIGMSGGHAVYDIVLLNKLVRSLGDMTIIRTVENIIESSKAASLMMFTNETELFSGMHPNKNLCAVTIRSNGLELRLFNNEDAFTYATIIDVDPLSTFNMLSVKQERTLCVKSDVLSIFFNKLRNNTDEYISRLGDFLLNAVKPNETVQLSISKHNTISLRTHASGLQQAPYARYGLDDINLYDLVQQHRLRCCICS
jgi:hypothetical protein